jgi:hypothetical protein
MEGVKVGGMGVMVGRKVVVGVPWIMREGEGVGMLVASRGTAV